MKWGKAMLDELAKTKEGREFIKLLEEAYDKVVEEFGEPSDGMKIEVEITVEENEEGGANIIFEAKEIPIETTQ